MSRRSLYGLLGAEAVSVTGTRMSVIAVPWFVLQSTGSPLQTGLVAFVELGALVVARTFGGRLLTGRAAGGPASAAMPSGRSRSVWCRPCTCSTCCRSPCWSCWWG